jgi:hypothetical protein
MFLKILPLNDTNLHFKFMTKKRLQSAVFVRPNKLKSVEGVVSVTNRQRTGTQIVMMKTMKLNLVTKKKIPWYAWL